MKQVDSMLLSIYFILALTAIQLYSSEIVKKAQEVKSYRACSFDGHFYGEGDKILVKEPCLNCSCKNGLISCYRKACPPSTIFGRLKDNCSWKKKDGECCPQIVCSDPSERNNETTESRGSIPLVEEHFTDTHNEIIADSENRKSRERDLSDDSETNLTITIQQKNIHDFLPDKISPRNCFHDGSIYSEGSAMAPSEKCTNCYCIMGRRKCMKNNCSILDLGPNCHPTYDDILSPCCPTRYICYDDKTTTTMLPTTQSSENGNSSNTTCWDDGVEYQIGHRVYRKNPCEICYCMGNGIECDKIECDTSEQEDGCKPILEDGECCPVSYNCTDDYSEPEIDFGEPINIKDGEVNDTVIAILLQHVFGNSSAEEGEYSIKPFTDQNFTSEENELVDEHSSSPPTTEVIDAEVTSTSALDSNKTSKDEEILKKEEGSASKFHPLFIDNSDLQNLVKEETSAPKPVRENDRLINILHEDHVIKQQFNLRKIPPLVIPTKDLPDLFPINRKPYTATQKKRPLPKFGPPPTLSPSLVQSIFSVLRAPTHQNLKHLNNFNSRTPSTSYLQYNRLQRNRLPSQNVQKRGRKEDNAPKRILPKIEFIPFVAADAVGAEGLVKNSGWGEDEKKNESFTTTSKPQGQICQVGDKNFSHGDMIPRNDPCMRCLCLYSQMLCKKERCSPTPPGCHSVRMEGDCCPVHTCGDGLVQIMNSKPIVNDEATTHEDKSGTKATSPGEESEALFSSTTPEINPKLDTVTTTITTTSTKPQPTTTTKSTRKPEKNWDDVNENGTFVSSVDVIPVGQTQETKMNENDRRIVAPTSDESTYNVGSVLRFGVADNQEIVEDDGILTSSSDFNPFDVLSDLFIDDGPRNPQPTRPPNQKKEWSAPIGKDQQRPIEPKTTRVAVPTTFATSTETTNRPTKVTTRKRTTSIPIKILTQSTTSTTTKRQTPLTTTTEPTTTQKLTTKHQIDLENSNSIQQFNDPWGLLKVSGCNIKGKTYMIDAEIPGLGGACKRCTCSSMGVVCQDLGC